MSFLNKPLFIFVSRCNNVKIVFNVITFSSYSLYIYLNVYNFTL